MKTYSAGNLDARNVGDNADIHMGGERVFGTITAIRRGATEVLIYLADNEEPLEVKHSKSVDIHLSTATLTQHRILGAIENLQDAVEALAAPKVATPGDFVINMASPLLKAV